MALRQSGPNELAASRRKSVRILKTVWKGSQDRASDDGMRFGEAIHRLIHEAAEGRIDIDPREDTGRGPGRELCGIYPDPEDWEGFCEFATAKGLSHSRAFELLLTRHQRGDFHMKVVFEFREKRGIKSGVVREEPEEHAA